MPDGRERSVSRRLITIGSNPDSELELDEPSVSRKHAVIEADANGYRLEDQDSKNGTFINGIRIETGYLPLKGTLCFGQVEIPFAQSEGLIEVSLSRKTEMAGMVGKSAAVREIFATVERVGPTDIPVLIQGESGTGKELVAQAIHQRASEDDESPFIVFDCSAVQGDLLESELFGHEAGAFSGAADSRMGALERAENGTLFIDEIGELAPELQPKLLRALDKGQFKRIGGNELKTSNARIIAATNLRLAQEVELGNFRQDLYFRLAGLLIDIPPLRDRIEDIPILTQHFLKQMGDKALGVQIPYETMEKLKNHSWPGNVRELKSALERAVLLSSGAQVDNRYLESQMWGNSKKGEREFRFDLPFKDAKGRLMDEFERAYWEDKLHHSAGNISQAARDGGIHRKSLEYLIKKLDISVEK